ncbi:MAG: ABC transporter permease subunit [Armatimonadia bacterium]|nr:ABC transporter permease subunit [Armatimonadia bacterium]
MNLSKIISDLGGEIAFRTYEHLFLTFAAMLIAIAIAVPLGIVLARTRLKAMPPLVMGAAGVVQTVPSLALIAFIVVIFALVTLPTIGVVPGLVALVLYALLPILRNTFTGIRQVDPNMIEVAQGMGMTSRQILTSVELPLALPVIMAGIRISTVWTIGVATLCALIGAGGLGDLILQGLQSIQMDKLLAGTIPAAALALVLDGMLSGLEKWLTPAGIREDEGEAPAGDEEPVKKKAKMPVKTRLILASAIVGIISLALFLPRIDWKGMMAGEDQRTVTTASGQTVPRETLAAGFDAEFLSRPDGYPGLKDHYNLEFEEPPRQLDPGLMYKAAAEGQVDVICAFATDGRIAAFDLTVLEDDQSYFPPYYAAPVVRADTLNAHQGLRDVLNMLADGIADEEMQELNYRVDEEGEQARAVALDFLTQKGLIDPGAQAPEGTGARIHVGGKNFTEQIILGQMMCLLLEHHTNLRPVRKLNLGGTMVCFGALKAGDLDLYVEYTGTGLVNILDQEPISDPQQVYDIVDREFRQEFDLVWLDPIGINNTYTLAMRTEQAERLGIETISDLAEYLRE